MAERVALDVRHYIDRVSAGEDLEVLERGIVYDLASTTRELARRRDELRDDSYSAELDVTPFHWVKDADLVTCPEYCERDVLEGCVWNDEKSRIESGLVVKTRKIFMEKENRYMVVWLSPPNENYEYTGARGTVAFHEKNADLMSWYGLGLDAREDFLRVAGELDEFVEVEHESFVDNEDVRRHLFVIDLEDTDDPFEMLKKAMPNQEEIWVGIKEGRMDAAYRETVEKMGSVARKLIGEIESGFEIDPDWLGFQAEIGIEKMGYVLQDVSDCGFSNRLIWENRLSVDSPDVRNGVGYGMMGLPFNEFGGLNDRGGIGGWMLGRSISSVESDVCVKEIYSEKYKQSFPAKMIDKKGDTYYYWLHCRNEKCSNKNEGYKKKDTCCEKCGASYNP